jgi:hypothetical protein
VETPDPFDDSVLYLQLQEAEPTLAELLAIIGPAPHTEVEYEL